MDSALVSMFESDLLDERATIREIERAADAAVSSARTALASAEREVMRADERLARVRRDYQDGVIEATDWREHRNDIEAGRSAAAAEVGRLAARVEELEREGAFAGAQTALAAILDDLRALAFRYDADAPDADLVASLRMAMAETIEGIEITSNAVPVDEIRYAPDPEVAARTVYLVTREAMIGVIVKRTTEQDVTRADGATFKRDLPTYERVGLPLSENTSLT